ncbi:Methylthioadenosine phosphorylase [Mycena epipterygia]|nr:Methylthioadenosine phosphorylase [Mycena epipterygia]
MSESKVLVGVIGGSGLYHLDNLTFRDCKPRDGRCLSNHNNLNLRLLQPWGFPSSPITISRLPSGTLIAFLARHGTGHTIPPSAVPTRANIAALKSLGARAILAFSAVGSLREEIHPGDFCLPSQIIDRTKGIRVASFFTGNIVAHASFADPFSTKLSAWLEGKVREALAKPVEGRTISLHTNQTVVCIEGPQFSTRAESLMYRQWGGDLINMSVLPEAKLAREAELSYALIATATDYDSWKLSEAGVTAADVFKTLQTNASTSRLVAAFVLDELARGIAADPDKLMPILTEEEGSMNFSMMRLSRAEQDDPKAAQQLAYILPNYFGASKQA